MTRDLQKMAMQWLEESKSVMEALHSALELVKIYELEYALHRRPEVDYALVFRGCWRDVHVHMTALKRLQNRLRQSLA